VAASIQRCLTNIALCPNLNIIFMSEADEPSPVYAFVNVPRLFRLCNLDKGFGCWYNHLSVRTSVQYLTISDQFLTCARVSSPFLGCLSFTLSTGTSPLMSSRPGETASKELDTLRILLSENLCLPSLHQNSQSFL